MIYRYPQDGMIAGVCSGLARTLGLEPWMVRVAAVLVSLFGGFFAILILYIGGVLLMEKAPSNLYTERHDFFKESPLNGNFTNSEHANQQTIEQLRAQITLLEKRIQQLEAFLYRNKN